ncbi:FadR/GntR family transcriptional regulator [Amycolatopsis taiwanensis]|uniref:GntR family transcriptional regulator n=1 Tax=Amycolatopsis taiwanensis TaxID=342230 RepID=A0A9W6R1D4_9PSEU|nr:FCD domain-containing protein [Amycolatopsis taiwanensis]GLY65867.1 GntR family transcriptional regulator [Amycolatopsis taiwanensis]
MDFEFTTPTVSEDIAARLRTLIHSGELGPGDRLPPERELAERMRVGRVSLREAIRLLQASGYVEVRRGATGGTFVTQLDRPYQDWLRQMRNRVDEIGDILDLRIGLEARAAALAARRRTDAQLSAMATAIDQLASSDSRTSFRAADAAFHGAVAAAAHNKRLETAIAQARGEMFTPVDRLVYTELIMSSQAAHAAVHEAIRDRNAELAARAMESHLEQTRQELHHVIFGGSRTE